jgi:hypothetical protein
MRVDPTGALGRLLTWYGLLGAPLAWTLLHVAGVWIATGTCSPVGVSAGATPQPWSIAVAIGCAVLALLGLAAAGIVYLSTRGLEEDAPPPLGRIHFLAVVGVVIAPLFIAIILMAGLGGAALGCEQG